MTGRDLALPADYVSVLNELTAQVRRAQVRAHRVVNTELLGLYWRSVRRSVAVRRHKAGARGLSSG